MGTGFSKKKKQAKLFQDQISKMQDEMQNAEFTGISGNGLVTLVITGEGNLKSLHIKPECVDPEDVEGLQDLIKAAFNDAQKKLKSKQEQGVPQMPPGLPGFF